MKVLILNSAQGKYPMGADPWIKASAKAVSSLASELVTMLCSTEPSPWNMVTYLAGAAGMNVELLIKAPYNSIGQSEFLHLVNEYKLDVSKTKPLFFDDTDKNSLHHKKLWQLRDHVMVHTADAIYPVSVRSGGRLDMLLRDETVQAKVSNDFRTGMSQASHRPQYTLNNRTIHPWPKEEWLVHWTRANQGQWPGENAWEYYHDILSSPDEYVRSAEATLVRMISSHCIRGSSWKLPLGESAVAFTALSIEEALPLMRWRQRFVRYSFEPYGLAVKRSVLSDLGAQEVMYSGKHSDDTGKNRLFYHASGAKTDWTREREWRFRGDLSLEGIDSGDIIAIVPDKWARIALQDRLKCDITIHEIFKD